MSETTSQHLINIMTPLAPAGVAMHGDYEVLHHNMKTAVWLPQTCMLMLCVVVAAASSQAAGCPLWWHGMHASLLLAY